MADSRAEPRLWLPQYWPSWLGVAAMRALSPLPLEALLAIGRALGRFAFQVVPVRRAVTLRNLALCFPELDDAARRRMARECYESLGMGVFEAIFSYYSPQERFNGRYTLEGWEHLEAARAAGRGVLLLSVHAHTMEIGGCIALWHAPLGAFYRNPKNPVIARLRTRQHTGRLAHMFAIDDMKGAVRALRDGALLWYAPDQGRRIKHTVIAPFFGVPAVSNAATRSIAHLGRALVIPWTTVRERRNGRWHYRVIVRPPLADLPEDSLAEATMVNQIIEDLVRLAPVQYLWQHKRFKNRGEGYPEEYVGMK
jgi:Kdo2-lipid IVA lauroyltransferase/acyltransferase